jgi:hypothetical protein
MLWVLWILWSRNQSRRAHEDLGAPLAEPTAEGEFEPEHKGEAEADRVHSGDTLVSAVHLPFPPEVNVASRHDRSSAGCANPEAFARESDRGQ